VATGLHEIEAVVLRCLGRERARSEEEQRKTKKYFFRGEAFLLSLGRAQCHAIALK
jgi:hypothetical protein